MSNFPLAGQPVPHPSWCDPAYCTAPATYPDAAERGNRGGHRSAPLGKDGVVFEGDAVYLTQSASMPWECETFLKIEAVDVSGDHPRHISIPLDTTSPLMWAILARADDLYREYPTLMQAEGVKRGGPWRPLTAADALPEPRETAPLVDVQEEPRWRPLSDAEAELLLPREPSTQIDVPMRGAVGVSVLLSTIGAAIDTNWGLDMLMDAVRRAITIDRLAPEAVFELGEAVVSLLASVLDPRAEHLENRLAVERKNIRSIMTTPRAGAVPPLADDTSASGETAQTEIVDDEPSKWWCTIYTSTIGEAAYISAPFRAPTSEDASALTAESRLTQEVLNVVGPFVDEDEAKVYGEAWQHAERYGQNHKSITDMALANHRIQQTRYVPASGYGSNPFRPCGDCLSPLTCEEADEERCP